MTPKTLVLRCDGPELCYLSSLLGGRALLGIMDPFPGWLTEEIQAAMEQARQNLEARGIIQVDAANRIHMDADVKTLLNVVTSPGAVFVYTLTLPGAQPVRQVFYWRAPAAVRLQYTEDIYNLDLLANPEAIYQEITRGWSAESQSPPPGEAIALPVPVLENVRHFLAQEALDDACSILRGAGATESTISALIETLRTLRRNGAIVALRPQRQTWYPAGLGLLESKNGLWGLRSFERYGQMWVEFSPMAASTLPEVLCCLMGRFATFDRNPV